MSELQVIESALERAARRRRSERALRGLWIGLLIGTVISLLMASAYHLLPLPLWLPIAAALVPFPCLAAGLIIGGWHKPALAQVARWVDGRQHLQERLSTALEVASEPNAGKWGDLVVTDAADHASKLDVGRQLADFTRRSLEKRPPALETTQKSMEAVGDLGDLLTKKAFTRSEAVKDLASVADKLKDQLNGLGKDPALKRLEQAARASTGNDSATTAGLQKQIESLQKQIGTPTGTPEALDKLQKQLQQLQQAAKDMAGQNAPGSEAERQKLSESLSALSKQAQEMGLQLPQLDEAISALAANQTDLFLKDLQASLTDLEKMRDMAKSLQQLQQQMEKLGKNLAEQLKNGQPEAAQMTLRKMVNQLKSANLSQEQLQKILQEVSQAVQPANNYGKVAEHLKTACTRMAQDADKPAAAQALAAAADELDKLMQQLGDAQELMATLDNLNQSSMCVGTCQGWGACKKPGFKPGGGRGSGVGTWADENNGWMYDAQWSDRWDNSGIVRPDMDPRGHTDRGQGELSDALKPTKVKGQFSPGGQMPSITLKGVSIKGQSKVAYEEAATAAQSDAQSALSQEKVPRAYQGAVRDYFDDLKK